MYSTQIVVQYPGLVETGIICVNGVISIPGTVFLQDTVSVYGMASVNDKESITRVGCVHKHKSAGVIPLPHAMWLIDDLGY